MLKRYSTFILVMFISLNALPQQEVQFSHNMFNTMNINPGYAGMRDAICGTILVRQQWIGFEIDDVSLHPETYNLNMDMPIPALKGGVSLGFLQDDLGYESNIGLNLGYSYHTTTLGHGKLGIGFHAGFLDKRLDFGKLKPLNEDPDLLSGNDESTMFFDFALGAIYKDEDWWGGLSVSQILESDREIGDGNSLYELQRHAYLTGGMSFPLPNYPTFELIPSMLIKTDINSMQIDLNTLIEYNEKFWSGLSYRHQDAIVVFLGLNIDQISVGYSYDISTSLIGRHGRSYGSHELMVQYSFDLDFERVTKPHRTTRFL